jgi:hypothetical protein
LAESNILLQSVVTDYTQKPHFAPQKISYRPNLGWPSTRQNIATGQNIESGHELRDLGHNFGP